MRTLQPKKQVERGTEHDGKTSHRVEKGNGEALAAFPPAQVGSKAAYSSCMAADLLLGGGSAAGCCRGDARRVRAEIQRQKEKKKSTKRHGRPSTCTGSKATEPQFAGGRGKTRRKYHCTLILFFSSSSSVCRCWRQDTGPDGARLYQVRPFSGGLSGSCS